MSGPLLPSLVAAQRLAPGLDTPRDDLRPVDALAAHQEMFLQMAALSELPI